MLKELIFTGMGASVLLRKKLEDEVKTLRKSGKLKKKDAKSFLKNLESTGKLEDKRIKKHFRKLLKETINDLGLVTKKDLKKLKAELKGEVEELSQMEANQDETKKYEI